MMSKQNVPELRFPGFSGEWEDDLFGSIVSNKSEKYAPNENEEVIDIELDSIESNTGRLLHTYDSRTQKSQKNRFNEGDVLYSKLRPYLNKFYWPDFPGVCTSEIWVFSSKNDDKLKNQFIYYFIQTSRFGNMANKSAGSKMPRADWKLVENIKFSYPKVEEQHKISDLLIKLDRLIELEVKKLELLEEQKKGYMQKIFSQELRFKDENGNDYPEWTTNTLKSVLLEKTEGIKRGPFGGALKKEIFNSSGFAVYEQQNAIYDNQNFRYFITEEKYKEMKSFSVRSQDLIMSCSGTIGRLSMIPLNYKEGVINQALIRFRVNNYLTSPLYFLMYMRSDYMQRKILESNPGSAITNLIPVKELKKLKFPLPDKEEQERITSFLSVLDNIVSLKNEKLMKLKEKRKGLLQKMLI